MCKYRLFDVGTDYILHDTGKIVDVKTPPQFDERNQLTNRGSVVSDLFNLFGFRSDYDGGYYPINYFYANGTQIIAADAIGIMYNITNRPLTWYLRKGT